MSPKEVHPPLDQPISWLERVLMQNDGFKALLNRLCVSLLVHRLVDPGAILHRQSCYTKVQENIFLSLKFFNLFSKTTL